MHSITRWIMADPYDTTDHYQDGYYTVPFDRFFLCGGKELHRRAESSGSSPLSLRHRLRIKASGAAVSFSEADPDLYIIGLILAFMVVIRHLLHRTF